MQQPEAANPLDRRWIAFTLISLFCVFQLYDPVLYGTFVFDDHALPFAKENLKNAPLREWITWNRPLLMFSYWVNLSLLNNAALALHAGNVLLHVVNGALALIIFRTFFPNFAVSAILAALFLIHPLQTESVAYVAGRSEALCAFFLLLAFVLYLRWRSGPITWLQAVVILACYVGAMLVKQHGVVLPALILLCDAYRGMGAIKGHWRLYTLFTVSGLAGLLVIGRVLATSKSAGFNLAGVSPVQYAITQARVVAKYLNLAIFPAGQSVDHDFPISRNLLEYNTWLYVLLFVTGIALAFDWRKKFPLATGGLFAALILLAPTSSFVPIADACAERRMYLPLLALLFILGEVLSRYRPSRGVVAVWLVILCAFTYQRNALWANPIALWLDTTLTSPGKARPYGHLAEAVVQADACREFETFFDKAIESHPKDPLLLLAVAKLKQCAGKPEQALELLNQTATFHPSSDVFELIGLLHGQLNNPAASKESLEHAVRINPGSVSANMSLALWHISQGERNAAAEIYRRVLAFEPNNKQVQDALIRTAAAR